MGSCFNVFDILSYYFLFPLGIVFNLILLWIIQKKSKKALLDYAILLKVACAVDLVMSVYNLIIQIHMTVINRVMVIFLTGYLVKPLISIIPNGAIYYIHTIQIGLKMTMMVLVVVSFVYRYMLVCRSKKLSGTSLFIVYVMMFIPAAFYTISRGYLLQKYAPLFARELPEVITECEGHIRINIYKVQDVVEPFDLVLSHLSLSTTTFNVMGFLVIVLSACLIVRFIRSNKASLRDPDMDKAISRTLTLQAAMPFIINYAPAIFVGLIQTFDTHGADLILQYTFVIQYWVPFFNPLIALYFIKDYRQAFQGLFRRLSAPKIFDMPTSTINLQ